MSKSNQKTIADLNINWAFDWSIESGIQAEIRELNPYTSQLKIKKARYKFLINEFVFDVDTNENYNVADLIYIIDSNVFHFQEANQLPKVLVLDKFELVSENTFRIHVKE